MAKLLHACVLMLLRVLILLYMCPHTTIGTNQHNARDAAESASDNEWLAQIYGQVNSLHALLVQKYKY